MIGLLTGHISDKDEKGGYISAGAHPLCLPMPEYFYNREVAKAAEKVWEKGVFKNGRVVDVSNSRMALDYPDQDIHLRIARAKQLGVECAVEIHHNFSDDPRQYDIALCLYWGQSVIGKHLARGLRETFHPFMRQFGVTRWLCIGLPDKNWGRYGAIYDSSYPTVILEPCFMAPGRLEYFHSENIEEFGKRLGTFLKDFWQKYYRILY